MTLATSPLVTSQQIMTRGTIVHGTFRTILWQPPVAGFLGSDTNIIIANLKILFILEGGQGLSLKYISVSNFYL